MRELLPMRVLLEEMGAKLKLSFLRTSLVRSTVFEDNQGCLSLVNVPKMSPRNKYLALKVPLLPIADWRVQGHCGQVHQHKGTKGRHFHQRPS